MHQRGEGGNGGVPEGTSPVISIVSPDTSPFDPSPPAPALPVGVRGTATAAGDPPRYALRPIAKAAFHETRIASEGDDGDVPSLAVGASAARRCFYTSPLRETDRHGRGGAATPPGAYPRSPATNAKEGGEGGVETAAPRSSHASPLADRSDMSGATASVSMPLPRSWEGRGDRLEDPAGEEGDRGKDGLRHHYDAEDTEVPRVDASRTLAVPLTPEEEQAARLRSYNTMLGGGRDTAEKGSGADGNAASPDHPGFIADTLHAVLPSFVERWTSNSVKAVAQTSSQMVPEGVKVAASTAAHTIEVGAQHIGDAIDRLPDLVVRAIPTAVMSQEMKHLLFTDFSNTFRSFFHTNILSMPFVFRQAGLVGGIVLLSFVAVTSEYATEAYFGAKNQMKKAHTVALYGDVPRMIWGDWYPMINLFYGITHLIGFIAFSSSNAVVLLGAMGFTGGGARAVGLIVPSLIALPLVLMKNAHSQQPLAILSNTLVLTSVLLMFIDFPYKPQSPIKLWSSSPSDFFVALGVTVYAFTGIGSTITVERVMAPQRYRKLLRLSVAISWSLLMAFGLSGFLSYGSHTCSVMTVSLQAGSLRTTTSALLFLASIMIIPQQTFPLCEMSDRRVLGITRLTTYWDLQPNLLRIAYLAISAFAAFIIPYYGLILSISGSLGCGIVGLVVPAALDYVRRERWALRRGHKLRFWEYAVVFGLGFYGCVVVVIGVVSGSFQLWKAIQTRSTDSC